MTTHNTPINSLEALDLEIYQLQMKAKQQEKTLDAGFDHLQENFHSMAWNSVVRYNSNKQSWISGVVNSLLGQERLKMALIKLAGNLAERAADGIEGLVSRLFRKKE
jgi:hypothetical protein